MILLLTNNRLTPLVQIHRRRRGRGRIEYYVDPCSEDLRDRYRQVAPGVGILRFAGLPEGIQEFRDAAINNQAQVSTWQLRCSCVENCTEAV